MILFTLLDYPEVTSLRLQQDHYMAEHFIHTYGGELILGAFRTVVATLPGKFHNERALLSTTGAFSQNRSNDLSCHHKLLVELASSYQLNCTWQAVGHQRVISVMVSMLFSLVLGRLTFRDSRMRRVLVSIRMFKWNYSCWVLGP